MSEHWIDPIYAGADGSYYTDWETARKLERGEWEPCLREERSGKRLVGTSGNELLMLVPTTRAALPDWAQVRVGESGARVVDTRRPVP